MAKERQIWVFGNPDKSELGFPDRTDLLHYMTTGVFTEEDRRYRYTSSKDADIIVLSRDGLAFGHFDIIEKLKPTRADKEAYPRVQYVYRVRKSSVYERPVLLSKLSIKLGQFGKRLTEDQFAELQGAAGKVTEYIGKSKLPESPVELEQILREIQQRLRQSEFRLALLEAYKRQCAVTGCDAVDALEAAHIVPYVEDDSQEPRNGLLLRADIHTLFDRQLIGINPKSLKVDIAPQLSGTYYEQFLGTKLSIPDAEAFRPDKKALKLRWKQFQAQK